MVQQKKSSSMQDLNLDEFLRMVDVATTVRHKQEEVDQQLNIHEVRDELKKKLQGTAQVTGEQLTDSQIEIAIDSYFDGLYSFKESPRNFGTKLAEVYVDRVRLAKKFGIPPLVAAASVGLIWTAVGTMKSASLRAKVRGVENAVETAYQEREKLLTDSKGLLSSPFAAKLPATEKTKLQSQLSNSQERLNSMDPFFKQYCSDGTAEDDINKNNYQEAKNSLVAVEDSINTIKTEIQEGRGVIQTQESLISTQRNLETLIGEVRGLKSLPVFSQRAENAYSAGIGEIERRNLDEAKQKERELAGVKSDISQFSNLTSKTDALYRSVRDIAKEELAIRKGETLYKEAKQLEASVDVPGLSQTISQLQDLDNILKQEYTVRIVSREDEKSGIDRYYNGKFSGWYLILEAVDSRGNNVPLMITNSENGKTEKVTKWGEKVAETNPRVVERIQNGRYNAQSLIQRVIKDKLDDGIVNDNIVGKKQKGYLDYKLDNPEFSGVRITRW